jgi:hypothetical protein
MWLFFLGSVVEHSLARFPPDEDTGGGFPRRNPRGGIGSHAQSILRPAFNLQPDDAPRPHLSDARTWPNAAAHHLFVPERGRDGERGFRGG